MSTYSVDEVNASARNLNDLLGVICELQFGLVQGDRDFRIDSLLWIARDISEGIIHHMNEVSAAAMVTIAVKQRAGEGAR
jgi:hypothetical protein